MTLTKNVEVQLRLPFAAARVVHMRLRSAWLDCYVQLCRDQMETGLIVPGLTGPTAQGKQWLIN